MILISVIGENVLLTDETIRLTKQSFIENDYKCLESAILKEFNVNDLPSYILWIKSMIEDMRNCTRYSFTFIQRAYFIQSGECVGLLG